MSRPPEDIDPKRLDVATSPRRRRLRAKPDPCGTLQADKPKALSRALRRPISPGIMFEPDGDGYRGTAPHSDLGLWELQLADCFATRSESVIRSFVDGLKALCSQAWDAPNESWKPNETELNAVLAMVGDIQPRNVAEACLASQMAAVHLLTIRLAAQALNRGHMVLDRDAALTGKLARTYAMQLETLQSLRGKRRSTRQTIKISRESHHHQHIHMHRGDEENGRQPHAAGTPAAENCPSLPSPDAGGEVVPIAGRRRKAGL